MIQVQFLEDTYIRKDFSSTNQTEIGYINSGQSILVKPEPLLGVARTHLVKNIAVTSDLWFSCNNGWYYWYGSTDVGFNKLQVDTNKSVRETQLKISQVPWKNIAYDPIKMPDSIKNYDIIDNFWNGEKLGTGVKLAILDVGFIEQFDILDSSKKINCTLEFDKSNFNDSSNHGGKTLAVAKYLSNNYYGMCADTDVYFFKIKYAYTPSIDQILKNIISAVKKCTEMDIDIINLSSALHPSSISEPNLINQLENAISDYSKTGLFICSSGNEDHIIDGQKGEELIPARFSSTICIGSYKEESGNVINDSLKHNNVNYYLKGANIKMPLNTNSFQNSSGASILFSSIMSLIMSKFSKITNSQFRNIIISNSKNNKYFDINSLLQNLKP